MELHGLEAPDELQINAVTQQARLQNTEKPKPIWRHGKKPDHYQNPCRQLKREKEQGQKNTESADNNNNSNSFQTNSETPNNTNANKKTNQKDRRLRLVYIPLETCGTTNHSTEKCYFGPNAASRPPPQNRRPHGQNQVQQRNAQSN